MTLQEMLDMELHHRTQYAQWETLMRVPGGWLYEVAERVGEEGEWHTSTTFVPEPGDPVVDAIDRASTHLSNIADLMLEQRNRG